MQRIVPISALALTTLLTISACSSPNNSVTAEENTASGPLDVSLITTYNGLPFYTAMQCGAEDAAEEMAGEITVTADGPSRGMNAADQLPVLEGVINRGSTDGIIFVPADPVAMIAPVEKAMETGIPVVTADGTLDKEVAIAQFHGDSKAGGALAAEEMIRATKGASGKILVLDNRPGLPLTNERAEGFIDAIKKSDSQLEILPTQYFQDSPTKAATIVQGSVEANPDIVGIFATSEAGAMGTVSGLAGSDADEDITVIAYDAGPSLVEALRAGTIDALIAQGSYQQGYEALQTLVSHIRGDESAKADFDNVIDNVLVTPDNVDDPEVSKFLYPESCD